MNTDIKIGVSLYSLTTQFIHGELDLEGCLKAVHDMGYKGVEIVAAQMVPDYPFPSDEWLYHFRGLLEKYDLEPVCWSAYIDMGFVPDFSIFQYMPHELYLRQAVEFGCRKDKLDEIVKLHVEGGNLEKLENGDFTEIEKIYGREMFGKFNHPATIEQFKDVADCIFYVHGKFYYLDNDKHDPCIPYEELIPKLVSYGYKGYIASEFEGHHFYSDVNCVEQLGHYVAMNENILKNL